MASPLQLRPLVGKDLSSVARIHCAAFDKSALTWLGQGAVRRYYDWQLTGPHECVALGAWQDETLCGFCFGGVFHGALGGFVRKHRVYLAGQIAVQPWLLLRPVVRQRFRSSFTTLLKRRRRSPRPGPIPKESAEMPSFGILAVAVDPTSKRGGVGRLLMVEMESAARRQGFSRMHLTVKPENLEAIRFYEHLGWVKRNHGGSWTGSMTRQLET